MRFDPFSFMLGANLVVAANCAAMGMYVAASWNAACAVLACLTLWCDARRERRDRKMQMAAKMKGLLK
jgi:hypothetical protein